MVLRGPIDLLHKGGYWRGSEFQFVQDSVQLGIMFASFGVH